MLITQNEFNAILRTDLLSFAERCFAELYPACRLTRNWHHQAIAYQLTRIMRGENNRLVVNVPPRSLKSFFISVVFPAYLLGKSPHLKIICVSYADDLAVKHAGDFRKIVSSNWYKTLFNTKVAKDTETEYETEQGGFRYTTTVGGTLTGRGGDIIILDDPQKPMETLSKASRDKVNDWFSSTLFSRLDNKATGTIIVVMQRLHQEDLSGYLLERPGWHHLNLPAIAAADIEIALSATKKHGWKTGSALEESREPISVLNDIKTELGSFVFQCQYLQAPVPEAGNLIKHDWFRFFDASPAIQPGDEIVQSWDTALTISATSDYSACLTFRIRNENEFYLIDVLRKRLEFPDLEKLVLSHAQQFQANTVLIEDTASGKALIQSVKAKGLAGVVGCKPWTNKADRMVPHTSKIESGCLSLPTTASWLDDFLLECIAFPNGKHDDQVDALSQLLEWRGNREKPIFSFDTSFYDREEIPSIDDLLRRLGRL